MSISPEPTQVHGANPHERPFRALPQHAIDTIRRGVAGATLRAQGPGAIRRAMVSTAGSAYTHGWNYADWATLLCESRSALGRQARTKDGRRDLDRVKYEKSLRSAWDRAVWFIENEAEPTLTRADIDARIALVRDWVADADSPVRDNDRAVLGYAVEVATRNGTDRPTMPLREVAAATGLSIKAVRLALERLDKARLLVLEIKGTPGGPNSLTRRASAYRLASADVLQVQTHAADAATAATVERVERQEPKPRVTQLRQPEDVLAARVRALAPDAMAEVEALLARLQDAPEPSGDAVDAVVVSLASYRRDVASVT